MHPHLNLNKVDVPDKQLFARALMRLVMRCQRDTYREEHFMRYDIWDEGDGCLVEEIKQRLKSMGMWGREVPREEVITQACLYGNFNN